MKLVESILVKNPCYKAGRKIVVKGLMLHSVGCPQPDARVFVKRWNSALYFRACVHAFIDGNDGTIYKTLPWNYRGWHCGSGPKGSGKDTHIGVEMCEPSCIKYYSGSKFTCSDLIGARAVAIRTYKAAVELFAYLCDLYRLDPMKDGVIISHKEGHERGIASNHGDPEHLWAGLGLSYTMDSFRKAVKKKMDEMGDEGQQGSGSGSDEGGSGSGGSGSGEGGGSGSGGVGDGGSGGGGSAGGSGMTDGDCPFVVRVDTANLNIRRGPGTDYARTGRKTGRGRFTIVAVRAGSGSKKGWGKLKSGLGWISLDFCVKVK